MAVAKYLSSGRRYPVHSMNIRLLLPVLLIFLLAACQKRNGYGSAAAASPENTVDDQAQLSGVTVSHN